MNVNIAAKIETDMRLVFARADFKTTIKGHGLQYDAEIDDSAAVWSYRLKSWARKTGRFGSEMALAIVSPSCPVYMKVTGDIQEEKICE